MILPTSISVYGLMGILSTFEDPEYQNTILDRCKHELDTYYQVVLPMIFEWIQLEKSILYRLRYQATAAEEGEAKALYDRKQAKSTLIEYIGEIKRKINIWPNCQKLDTGLLNQKLVQEALLQNIGQSGVLHWSLNDAPSRWEKRRVAGGASSSGQGQPLSSSQDHPGTGPSQSETPRDGRMRATPSEWFILPAPGTTKKQITRMDYYCQTEEPAHPYSCPTKRCCSGACH